MYQHFPFVLHFAVDKMKSSMVSSFKKQKKQNKSSCFVIVVQRALIENARLVYISGHPEYFTTVDVNSHLAWAAQKNMTSTEALLTLFSHKRQTHTL